MSGFGVLFSQPWKHKNHPHKMWMNRPEADSHLSPAGSPLGAAPHRQNTGRFLSSVNSTSVITVQSGCQGCWVAGQSLCVFWDGQGCLGLVYCQCVHLTALKPWLLVAVVSFLGMWEVMRWAAGSPRTLDFFCSSCWKWCEHWKI